MTVLTAAEFEALKASGWHALDTTCDISYKSHRTMWHAIREFVQNALDEHDEAGISALPALKRTPQGLLIADQGRGLGAEALLLRETKRASGAAMWSCRPLVLAATNRSIGPHYTSMFVVRQSEARLATLPEAYYTQLEAVFSG